MKSIREKKKWINDYNQSKVLIEDLEVIFEFFKENEATLADVEDRYTKALTLIEDLEFRNKLQLELEEQKVAIGLIC